MTLDGPRVQVASGWEIQAHLLFLGANNVGPAFDPDELTAIIGVVPTSQWRVGDPNQLGASKRTSGWELDSTAGPTAPLSEHVESLLEALRGYERRFAEAASLYRVRLECVIGTDAETASPELVIPLEQIESLAALRVSSIGFDISR